MYSAFSESVSEAVYIFRVRRTTKYIPTLRRKEKNSAEIDETHIQK